MARPDMKIGEHTFHPKDGIRSRVSYLIDRLGIEWSGIKSGIPPAQEVIDWTRISSFYGPEAANTFVKAITPSIPSTVDLQIERQGWWAGYPSFEPTVNPITRLLVYRFVQRQISP